MKRRLNILCLVVMLVLSYSVLEQGYYIFLGAKMGAQTGLELGKKGSDIAAYKELMNLTYIIHSGFISGYQNRYGDNLKPPTNVYHRMTA